MKAGKINTSVDVYAFGCVLIELFGEKKVWEGFTAIQIMVKVAIEGALPDFSHLPQPVKSICAQCLEKQENRIPAKTVLRFLLSL